MECGSAQWMLKFLISDSFASHGPGLEAVSSECRSQRVILDNKHSFPSEVLSGIPQGSYHITSLPNIH